MLQRVPADDDEGMMLLRRSRCGADDDGGGRLIDHEGVPGADRLPPFFAVFGIRVCSMAREDKVAAMMICE